MQGITGTFDATQYEPRQGGDAHPSGKFQAQVTNTAIKPTKANDGGMFAVEFTTPSGTIVDNYQLWNQNPKTVEIAQRQLSALCHATGVFKLDWANEGAALRGARCMIEVGPQLDAKTKEPNGYVEVKKVFDLHGNEPGKAPASAPQNQPTQQQQPTQWNAPQTAQPMTQQSNGGWGQAQAPNPPAATPQPNQGWQQNQPQQTTEKPPWAK